MIETQTLASTVDDVGKPSETSPKGYETLPPELRPDENGNPPEVTPQLLKKLRGKYFTVRHVRLGVCGHLLDMINQPKNNCDSCWLVFYNTHPQLVEVAHQFYKTQGRRPMVAMRGEKFVRFFERYMATLYKRQLEEQELQSPVVPEESGTAAAGVEDKVSSQEPRSETPIGSGLH